MMNLYKQYRNLANNDRIWVGDTVMDIDNFIGRLLENERDISFVT